MFETFQQQGSGISVPQISARIHHPSVPGATGSLIYFIWNTRVQRRTMLLIGLLVIAQLTIFKVFYPFPDFFSDSYSYIFAASANLDISIWPIGYSKFLRAFHFITASDNAIIIFQYIFLEMSAMLLYFSLLYFYDLKRITRIILFCFLFIDPLFLYISNYINSDPLFAALSFIWFTQLIWILNRNSVTILFTHAIILFLCFTVRNNAYYYPIVSILTYLISRYEWRLKLAGIVLPVLMITTFVIHTRNEAYKLTGTRQFSLFTGWQLANNALYMYDKIDIDPGMYADPVYKELNELSKDFYAKIPTNVSFHQYLTTHSGNFFIQYQGSPLKSFWGKHYPNHDDLGNVVSWGQASAVFMRFGKYLIQRNPIPYIRYFLLLNARNYYLPPMEKLNLYNLGENEVPPVVQDWFGYKTPFIRVASHRAQGTLLAIFPYLFMFINVFAAGSLIWLIVKRRTMKPSPEFTRLIILTSAFVYINQAFTIIATINVMRYQFFPMAVLLLLLLVLLEIREKKEERSKNVIA